MVRGWRASRARPYRSSIFPAFPSCHRYLALRSAAPSRRSDWFLFPIGVEWEWNMRHSGTLFPGGGAPERTTRQSPDEGTGAFPQARTAPAVDGAVSIHHLGEAGGPAVRCTADWTQSRRCDWISPHGAARLSGAGWLHSSLDRRGVVESRRCETGGNHAGKYSDGRSGLEHLDEGRIPDRWGVVSGLQLPGGDELVQQGRSVERQGAGHGTGLLASSRVPTARE